MHPTTFQPQTAPRATPAAAAAATLASKPAPAAAAVTPPANGLGDRDSRHGVAFRIGWDLARHALAPPPEHLNDDTGVLQGWLAGRAAFGTRTLTATRWVRWWLQWRLQAWQEGISWEDLQLTPHYLSQLDTARCPVLREPLNGQPGDRLCAVLERLNPAGGYAAGNLALMSRAAAQARQGLDLAALVRRARQAEALAGPVDGLDAAAWWRLATLTGLALPPQALPFHLAAQLPLAVLPPNRVRVMGPALGLQALLTHSFARAGWAARARRLAAWLPAHSLRHDFNLFVGAIAPRLLEAAGDATAQRQALEDAWLHERVQRRWQHFVLTLGETGCAALLAQAAREGLAGLPTLELAPEQAVEGWGLPEPTADRAGQRRIQASNPRPARRAPPWAAARCDTARAHPALF